MSLPLLPNPEHHSIRLIVKLWFQSTLCVKCRDTELGSDNLVVRYLVGNTWLLFALLFATLFTRSALLCSDWFHGSVNFAKPWQCSNFRIVISHYNFLFTFSRYSECSNITGFGVFSLMIRPSYFCRERRGNRRILHAIIYPLSSTSSLVLSTLFLTTWLTKISFLIGTSSCSILCFAPREWFILEVLGGGTAPPFLIQFPLIHVTCHFYWLN